MAHAARLLRAASDRPHGSPLLLTMRHPALFQYALPEHRHFVREFVPAGQESVLHRLRYGSLHHT